MPVIFVRGDLFLSGAQTLGHGVNCRGKMGAGIATEFRRRFPEMFEAYREICRTGELEPGRYFLWKESTPWVLNLATQASTHGARPEFVRDALHAFARRCEAEGVTSLALPRLAAGLGGLAWEEVRAILEEAFAELPIPVHVYEEYLPGVQAEQGRPRRVETGPLHFYRRGGEWGGLSNFEPSPIEVDGREYATVEHYFQACKAVDDAGHETVRLASSPMEAKRLGRRIRLRPDWEKVKVEVMRAGLRAKFTQHPHLRELLLSTGERVIHEDAPNDPEWGWVDGRGRDLLGKLLREVREELRRAAPTV